MRPLVLKCKLDRRGAPEGPEAARRSARAGRRCQGAGRQRRVGPRGLGLPRHAAGGFGPKSVHGASHKHQVEDQEGPGLVVP